jgi:hypothetical protein
VGRFIACWCRGLAAVAILAAFALCVFVQSATTALVGDGTAAGALAAAAGVTATAVACCHDLPPLLICLVVSKCCPRPNNYSSIAQKALASSKFFHDSKAAVKYDHGEALSKS